MSANLVFLGNIVSSSSISKLEVFFGYLCVDNGTISEIGKYEEFTESKWTGYKIVKLEPHQFLMPGFVDCHTHAPQFPNIGLGLDLPLLEWLDKYTFPLEKKYEDPKFAAKVYDKVVRRLLDNGTTTACYFGSLHLEGTKELANSVRIHRQRAFVGKVSMNVKNDAGYYNEMDKELAEVDAIVKYILDYKDELVQPIITPRFALSCCGELMTHLAGIADKYNCRIQSHVSENKKEIEHVLSSFPHCKSYSEVYERSSIFDHRCILAHAVHLSDSEMRTLSARGVAVAHCPASNTRLRSGLCPARRLLDHHIAVGLGTDVAGGDSASILDAMRRAMDVSTHLELMGGEEPAFNWREAFYLATRGGAKALFLDKVGCLEVSYDFDALVVDVRTHAQTDAHSQTAEEHIQQLIQQFVYLGDDRNIVQVYVKGQKVKDTTGGYSNGDRS